MTEIEILLAEIKHLEQLKQEINNLINTEINDLVEKIAELNEKAEKPQ